MASSFEPVDDLEIFCRFCNKLTPSQLDRSIAENGRTVDRNSTFEYLCSKCLKTFCFSGRDLLEQPKPDTPEPPAHDYAPRDHFYIGEKVFHKKWKESGMVVGKEKGSPGTILVKFERSGLKKLIENLI